MYSRILKSIDCEVCNGKGFTDETRYNEVFDYTENVKVICPCVAQQKRRNQMILNIQKSGLSKEIENKTFSTYIAETDWQKDMLHTCKQYTKDKWLLLAGQSGVGKSHLGVATAGQLLMAGNEVLYFLWRDKSMEIKGSANNGELYQKLIQPFKTCDVLYIDDLFKTEKNSKPTQADIQLCIEILNYRLLNQLSTIISTEFTLNELISFDEAITGRIVEMCGVDNIITIGKDIKKNYRLKGLV